MLELIGIHILLCIDIIYKFIFYDIFGKNSKYNQI
jgi:hypothetical protein